MLSGVALKISHCIIGSSNTGLQAIFWVTEPVLVPARYYITAFTNSSLRTPIFFKGNISMQ